MTSISIILPLYNAEHLAPQVLPPLRAARERGEVEEVIVIDDGSTDDGARVYREAGFEVIASGGRCLGPGACRNLGIARARGDVVLMIDSDVVMRADVPAKVRAVFDAHPDCVALFGSYDDEPAAPGLVTRYRNLLHHHVHQQGREEASTFWAGCGAVRRTVFEEVGGFDVARYPYPSIEDIELGYRLLAKGRILLQKDIQCKHLKRWTLGNMLHTDIFRRALPWSRLLMQPDYQVNDLNVNRAEKVKALLAGGLVLSLLAIPWWPPAALLSVLLLALAFAANASFFRLVIRKYGLLHGAAAVLLHQLYYLYSSATFVYAVLEHRLQPAARAESK